MNAGPRTVLLDDTLIVVAQVRAAKLEPSFSRDPADGGWQTLVWIHGREHPLYIRGDFLETLQNLVEGGRA